MKFLKFSIVALLLSASIASCEKDKDVASTVQTSESPVPVPEVKPVQGTWMGNRYGLDKSIPVYFGFEVKAQAKLDVLNKNKQVIGTGAWSFDNDVFTATYTINSSGVMYSVKSNFYDKPDKIGGTWGFDNSDSNGGTWIMDKVN